ncbi:MAG TPA: hypothetical protein DEP84_11720 [Chloroflexi bacterium]|nr:hypothetical protein [Chloroflexota bacterium]
MHGPFARWMVRVWLACAVLLWAVVPLGAQLSVHALVQQTKFVAIPLTDEGPSLAQFRAEPGQPLVILIQNSNQVPHCLSFDIPPPARVLPLGEGDFTGVLSRDCPPAPNPVPVTPGGPPILSAVDLNALQSALQCGPMTAGGRVTGYWAYQLPGPVAPGENATLCFIVAAPGRYPFYDPLDRSWQGLLIVGPPGSAATPTASPTPAPPPTSSPPATLPETGATPSSGWPAPFWLLPGVWALALGVLVRPFFSDLHPKR